jgi:hypothetical protein
LKFGISWDILKNLEILETKTAALMKPKFPTTHFKIITIIVIGRVKQQMMAQKKGVLNRY